MVLRRLDAGLNWIWRQGLGLEPVAGDAGRDGFGFGMMVLQAAGDETVRRRFTPAEDLPDDQGDNT